MSRYPTNTARTRRMALTLCLCLPLGGCGLLRSVGLLPALPEPAAPPPPPPPPPEPVNYPLTLQLKAGDGLNPDAGGRASPLRVHLYVTERDPRIAAHGFGSVFGAGPAGTDPNAGAAPAPNETLVLAPSQRVELTLEPSRNDRYISVAAAFREPWSALWSDTIEVNTSGPVRVVVDFGAAAILLQAESSP